MLNTRSDLKVGVLIANCYLMPPLVMVELLANGIQGSAKKKRAHLKNNSLRRHLVTKTLLDRNHVAP